METCSGQRQPPQPLGRAGAPGPASWPELWSPPMRLRFWGSGSRTWLPHPLPAPAAHVDGVTAASRATTARWNRPAAPPRSPAERFRAPSRLPRTSCPLVGQGRTATARRAAPPPPCCRPPPPAAATFPLRPRAVAARARAVRRRVGHRAPHLQRTSGSRACAVRPRRLCGDLASGVCCPA